MDLKKSKVILKKINALHESAEAFDGRLSAIERDLLLHYVRELYESLHPVGSNSIRKGNETGAKDGSPERSSHMEIPDPVIKESQKEVVYTAPETQSQTKDALNAKDENGVSDSAGNGEDILISDELEELFNESIVHKPGSRFENLPISDISKSMGINDRILTINDLFEGDQHAFNECIRHLNNMTSFDDAKAYLVSEVALKNEWHQPQRRNKAQSFIRLVKRRYL
jgi:hypothetical protein